MLLATAVALKRVGIGALVLEKSEGLRATGGALGLQPNAWLALDALGVSHKLTTTYAPCIKYFASTPLPFLIKIMYVFFLMLFEINITMDTEIFTLNFITCRVSDQSKVVGGGFIWEKCAHHPQSQISTNSEIWCH